MEPQVTSLLLTVANVTADTVDITVQVMWYGGWERASLVVEVFGLVADRSVAVQLLRSDPACIDYPTHNPLWYTATISRFAATADHPLLERVHALAGFIKTTFVGQKASEIVVLPSTRAN